MDVMRFRVDRTWLALPIAGLFLRPGPIRRQEVLGGPFDGVTESGGALSRWRALERRKSRNIAANPKVTVVVIDPTDGTRYIEVRGEVTEISQDGAVPFADRLTQLYTGKQRFYGDVYPAEKQTQETRILCRIQPTKVNVDAVFI